MVLKIGTNLTHETVLRHLNETQAKTDKALEQLSSGKRIVKTSDDVAGVGIVDKLRAQVRSLQQASRNAQDGISMIQVAEGGLSEISNVLVRLRELSIQSASDTVGDPERDLLHREFQQLVKGVDQITDSTKINYIQNGHDKGELGTLSFHIGANAGEENKIEFDFDTIDTNSENLGVSAIGVSSKEDALASIEHIDKAIEKVSGVRASVGAVQSRMQSAFNNLENHIINHEHTRSVIEDVDVAKVASELTTNEVIKKSAVAVLAQTADMPRNLTKLIS